MAIKSPERTYKIQAFVRVVYRFGQMSQGISLRTFVWPQKFVQNGRHLNTFATRMSNRSLIWISDTMFTA